MPPTQVEMDVPYPSTASDAAVAEGGLLEGGSTSRSGTRPTSLTLDLGGTSASSSSAGPAGSGAESGYAPLAPLHHLRAALLGYLGEVEGVVRGRVRGDAMDGILPGQEQEREQEEGQRQEAGGVSGVGGEGPGSGTGTGTGTSDVEDTSYSDMDVEEGEDVDEDNKEEWGVSSARPRQGGSVLRHRRGVRAGAHGPITSSSSTSTEGRVGGENQTSSGIQHDALLSHLSSLKSDVQAYLPALPLPFRVGLPSGTPSAASAGAAVEQTQDWLRTLPGRLRQVEMAMPGRMSMPALSGFPFGAYAALREAASGVHGAGQEQGQGQGRYENHETDETPQPQTPGTLESARQRVLEMVRSVLPSDEWEGWERLGWEETEETDGRGVLGPYKTKGGLDGLPPLTRSMSHPTRMVYDDESDEDDNDEEEEDEDEEEEEEGAAHRGHRRVRSSGDGGGGGGAERTTSRFLFPNRTPAAAEAIARRRTMRSRSLGSAGYAGQGWAGLAGVASTRARVGTGTGTGSGTGTGAGANHDVPRIRISSVLGGEQSTEGEKSGDGVRFAAQPQIADEGYFASPSHFEGRGGHDFDSEEDEDGDEDEDREIDVTEPLLGGIADPTRLGAGPGTGGAAGAPTRDPLMRNPSSVQPGYEYEFGPNVAEALVLSGEGTRLLDYRQLPVHWRNNEHILTGYRFIPLHASTGPIPLIQSAFAWHNETLNIQSHFIPTILISCFIPYIIYASPLPNAHALDTAILALYLVAAVSCLFTSASWHVLSGCASRKWFEWGACVDYIGISWLIAASFGTVVYNAFYCRPNLVALYLGTNAACGALGSYLPFQRWFNLRRMKPWRIAFFLFLNFAMFAPVLQLVYLHGWEAFVRYSAAFTPSVLSYVTGLLFYGFHFPECVWPGRFDYWLASHQLWHTGIVVAIYLHYRAVFVAHDMRYDLSCAVPGAGPGVGEWLEQRVRAVWG